MVNVETKGSEKSTQLQEGYILNEAGEMVPDYDCTIKVFDEGDVIQGTIVKIDRDEILVDVGYKSEGVIPVNELSIRKNTDPNQIVELGQEVATYVLQKEDADGRLILSKKRAEFEKAWDRLEDAHKNKDCVEGAAIEVVKGGLILDIGVRGFLPASLVDINRVKDLQEFVGQELKCKIIELNRFRNNVVLSRKAALHGDIQQEKSEIINKVTKGQVVEGKVSSIVDFGAFVDLGGIDGLIHISELSWNHVDHPSEMLTIGQSVKVMVLDVDKKKARISLGLKQTQEDSWKTQVTDLKPGEIYKAKVTRILPFGVFVQFNDLEGLIHISELAYGKTTNPHKHVEVGNEIEVKLLSIDEERRRISLSYKQTKEPEGSEEEASEETTEEEVQAEATEAETPVEAPVEEPAAEETAKEATEPEAQDQADAKMAEAVEEAVQEVAEKVIEEAEKIKEEEAPAAEKPEIKVKPAEEKLREELAREKAEEEKEKAALENLSEGLKEDESDEASDSEDLGDILEQMKKSHGSRD